MLCLDDCSYAISVIVLRNHYIYVVYIIGASKYMNLIDYHFSSAEYGPITLSQGFAQFRKQRKFIWVFMELCKRLRLHGVCS